ncbi:MAG: SMI1/KNR4 family protein [Pseudomarimonas sp.]
MTALHDAWRQLTAITTPDAMAAEPPATDAEIAKAEKKLKRPLPPAVAAMLRLSRAWGWYEEGLDTVIFLPPDEIVAQTLKPKDESLMLDVEDAATSRVAAKVYGPGRTTFARTDYLFFQVDDDPPPGGRPGQIVSIDFEEGIVDLVAESVDEFIARGLCYLKAQAGAEAIAIPNLDAATLPPLVPMPERKPLKQPKASDATCAALLGIDAWLYTALPPHMKRFKAGAPVRKIRQFLAEGHELPEALFPLFETFNGQSPQRVGLLPCPLRRCPGLVLYDFEDCARGRDNTWGFAHYAKPKRDYVVQPPAVKDGYWRKEWGPIARSVLENPDWQVTLFVDFEPAPGGTPGQVVLDLVGPPRVHPEQGERHVVAPSVQAYLDGVLAAMQADELAFRDGKGVGWVR